MVCGKDGQIYVTLAQAGNRQVKLVSINGTTGYLESIAEKYPCDMELVKIYFLRDGRLLIMDPAAENVTFHYLPVSEP